MTESPRTSTLTDSTRKIGLELAFVEGDKDTSFLMTT